MYTGTMIEDLMNLTGKMKSSNIYSDGCVKGFPRAYCPEHGSLGRTEHVSANCDEVLRGDSTGQDVLTCRAETFEQCSNDDCQMPVCQKHEVVCKNCGERFCKPCFLGHVC